MRLLYSMHDQDWRHTKSLGILKSSLAALAGLAVHPSVRHIDVLGNTSLAPLLPPESARVRLHLAAQPAPRRWRRLWWDQWELATWVGRLKPDWLLLPKGFTPLLRVPACRISAYVHDDVFAHYAALGVDPFPFGQSLYFSRSLDRTARTADVLVTGSAFAADELARLRPCRAQPVPIGCPLFGDRPRGPAVGDPRRVLLLASPFPHKLTAQALAWLARFDDAADPPIQVVAVGRLPAGLSWPARKDWILHPRLSETEFERVRASCGTLVYFSAYEGYGLPPLEALRDGQRVAASDLPPLRENLPASMLFPNHDYAGFRTTLLRVMSQPRSAIQPDTGEQVAARWLERLLNFR